MTRSSILPARRPRQTAIKRHGLDLRRKAREAADAVRRRRAPTPDSSLDFASMAFAWEIWNFHSASGGFPDVPRPLNLNLGFALHPSGLHFSLRQLRGSDHFQHGVREGGEEFGSGCFALSPRSYRGLDGRGKLKLWAAALAVFNRKGRLTRKQLCDLVDGFRAQQVLCSFFNRWRGVIAGAYSTEDFFRLFVALVDDVPSMRDCIQAPSRLSVPKTDRAAAQVLCRRLLFWQFQEIYFLRQELWVNLHIAPQARIDAWFLEKKFSVQTCWFSRDVDLRVQNALIRRKIAYDLDSKDIPSNSVLS